MSDFVDSFTEKEITPGTVNSLYKCLDLHARKVQEQALTAMFGKLRPLYGFICRIEQNLCSDCFLKIGL